MSSKLTLFVYFFSLCCISLCVQAQYTLEHLSLHPFQESQVSKTFVFQNLQLYPIYAHPTFLQAHQNTAKYSSLQKALEQKQVFIEEKPMPKRQRPDNDLLTFSDTSPSLSSSQITQNNTGIFDDSLLHPEARETYDFDLNHLFFINQSQDTIFLMAGEMIKGGKQDRILAQDMILPPNSGKVEIPVFCAEKDRWTYNTDAPKAFRHTGKISPLFIRSTIQMPMTNQSEVWNAIQLIDVKQALILPSEDQNEGYNNLTQAYLNFFGEQFGEDKTIVGILAISGERILGCDIFATPQLFQQQYPNLLYAYAAEAILHGTAPILPLSGAYAYLHQCLRNEQAPSSTAHHFKVGSTKIHLNTY